jgi:hypothetical protein
MFTLYKHNMFIYIHVRYTYSLVHVHIYGYCSRLALKYDYSADVLVWMLTVQAGTHMYGPVLMNVQYIYAAATVLHSASYIICLFSTCLFTTDTGIICAFKCIFIVENSILNFIPLRTNATYIIQYWLYVQYAYSVHVLCYIVHVHIHT